MRRAGAVSVSGALLLALVCLAFVSVLSGPVGAQQQPADPLAEQTADIADADGNDIPDSVGPIAVAGCQVTAGETAIITVADADGNEEVFTDGEGVVFEFGPQGITITADAGGDLQVDDEFDPGTGSVVSSDGITCTAAAPPTTAEPPAAPACPAGTTNMDTFTSDDTAFGPFRVSAEDFQVLYAIEDEDEDQTAGDESFSVAVIQGEDPVSLSEAVTTAPADGTVEVNGEGPGTFRLDVNADGVVFALTVCEGDDVNGGGGGGGGGGQGDLNCDDFASQAAAQANLDDNPDDPNNLDADDDEEACEDFPFGNVLDDDDDDELVNTGGPPLTLLAGLCLVLASSALVRAVRRG